MNSAQRSRIGNQFLIHLNQFTVTHSGQSRYRPLSPNTFEGSKMIPKDGFNPKYFAAVLRRRLWYVVLPFFLISLGSVVYCIKTPKLYKSSTLILIQPQEVPDDYVQPLVKIRCKIPPQYPRGTSYEPAKVRDSNKEVRSLS